MLSRNGQYLRDQGTVQLAVLHAARAGVLEANRAMEDETSANGRVSSATRARYWTVAVLAFELCMSALNRLQAAAGIDSFRTDLPFDRAIRDARAIRQSFDSFEAMHAPPDRWFLG